jgi:hypothetical protein
MIFCTDIDLLHWEPSLCQDAAFASQTLISGTGDLAGSVLTIASGSFVDAHVEENALIVLSGATSGTYPIVSVDSATQLTLSTLYDGLFPTSGTEVASSIGTATGLTFAVRTFWAQRRVASDLILQAAGLDPGDALAGDCIINPYGLKRACTLGALHMIYSALAGAAVDSSNLMVRVEMYERLYRRALRNARIELDLDGDGEGDTARILNVMELQRI